ncbi:uncharacterized protein LOC110447976 [Mizuhopecten yessoensis]|uniref:uncharacterized protein LOC110447976 n=1 Tax=Mizuhopecten yessoensis TaxID=6573 RepID=UPI000B458190|nr:uncharacterized protein LOC110447976 [Mizuhopecten yessoensis]XP_021349655.1 uncharacterized protein LOC110447976 [Mizuhopecten yessoensis]
MAEGGIGSWDDGLLFSDDDLFSEGPGGNIGHRQHLQPFRFEASTPSPSQGHGNGGYRNRNSSASLPPTELLDNATGEEKESRLEDNSVASEMPSSLSGSEITDCPICLDTLERPKALPCLHTFCFDCLGSFIEEKATKSGFLLPIRSFPCPICRRDSSPIDPTKPHTDWSNQFPTNNIMLELIRIGRLPEYPIHNAKQSNKPKSKSKGKAKPPENKYCRNCQIFNRKTVKANLHCEQCSVNLCETCDSVLHLHAPDHTRVYVDAEQSELKIELSPLVTVDQRHFYHSRLVCRRHGGKFDCFCMSHKVPICVDCMKEEHSTCDGVHTFREYSRILKRERSELKTTIKNSLSAMEAMLGLFKQHIHAMSDDRESSVEHIRDMRNDINNHLDEMEKELKDQVLEVSKGEEQVLLSVAERCENVNDGLNRSLVRLNAALQDGDDQKIISAALFCHAQIQQCVTVVKEISGFHSLSRLSVLINPLLTAALDLDTFGETNFVREKTDLPSSVRKLLPFNVRSAREILRYNVRTREDRFPCGITSALYLPNNQVILIDFPNKAVKLFSDYGHLVMQVRLSSGPWDICSVDDLTFAVTLPFEQIIVFIQRDPMTSALIRIRDIRVKKCCYGITLFRGGLVISCPSECKVTLFNVLEIGNKCQLTQFCKLPLPCWQLVTNNFQREVISTHDTENGGILKVSSLDKFSEKAFGPNLVKGLRGCDVDKEGNVYICGRKTRNIVQVSPSSGSRVLLTLAHGLKEPSTIAVREDKFLVAEVASSDVGIYELF